MTPDKLARLLLSIRDAVWLILPAWYVLYVLKGLLSLWIKRSRLKKSLVLNIDGRFEIAGKRGQLVFFGWWYLTLKNKNNEHHHIPMLTVVDSIITRLDHMNGRVNTKKGA